MCLRYSSPFALSAPERASIMRASSRLPNATTGLLRRKRRLYLTKRGPTAINRARETTKRAAVPLPRELLDTPLANGSRRPARLLLCCCWKNRRGPDPALFLFSTLYFFPRGDGRRRDRAVFSLFLFYFFFCARARDGKRHDMIGSIDYL